MRAAGSPVPMPTRPDADEDPTMAWEFMATYLGVRSRFFDEFLGSAAAAGLDQVVLLAAGLDTRAFRLDWQPGTTVYELDAPKVLQFKDRVLTEQRAQPRCQRRTVAVDLREDWPAAVSTARAVEIAQRYRRPLDEMALSRCNPACWSPLAPKGSGCSRLPAGSELPWNQRATGCGVGAALVGCGSR